MWILSCRPFPLSHSSNAITKYQQSKWKSGMRTHDCIRTQKGPKHGYGNLYQTTISYYINLLLVTKERVVTFLISTIDGSFLGRFTLAKASSSGGWMVSATTTWSSSGWLDSSPLWVTSIVLNKNHNIRKRLGLVLALPDDACSMASSTAEKWCHECLYNGQTH